MIYRLHARLHVCLRNICNDKYSTFEELYTSEICVSLLFIHKRNLRFVTIEIFKVMKGISPPIVNELFDRNEGDNYKLRNHSDISLPIVKTVFSGLETL